MGNFIVGEVSFQLIAALRPLVPRIKRQDRSLADQLVRAKSTVVLNIAEADYSDPGNKRARLFTAAGTANETRAALRVAAEWGYCGPEDAAAARQLLERIVAMLLAADAQLAAQGSRYALTSVPMGPARRRRRVRRRRG